MLLACSEWRPGMLSNTPHCPRQPSSPSQGIIPAPPDNSTKTGNSRLKTGGARDLGTWVFRTLKELMGRGGQGGTRPAGPSPPLSPPDVPAASQVKGLRSTLLSTSPGRKQPLGLSCQQWAGSSVIKKGRPALLS